MTIYDLRCDRCGVVLVGPAMTVTPTGHHGVRFRYHPGAPELGDDAGLLCETCWQDCETWLGASATGSCSRCGADLRSTPALTVSAGGDLTGWLLCTTHACELLNSLRTVDPKLDPATFRLPSVHPPTASAVRLRARPPRRK